MKFKYKSCLEYFLVFDIISFKCVLVSTSFYELNYKSTSLKTTARFTLLLN